MAWHVKRIFLPLRLILFGCLSSVRLLIPFNWSFSVQYLFVWCHPLLFPSPLFPVSITHQLTSCFSERCVLVSHLTLNSLDWFVRSISLSVSLSLSLPLVVRWFSLVSY